MADRGAVPHVVPVCFAVAGQSLYVTIAAAIPAIEAENQAASPGAPIGQSNPAIFRSVRALKSRIRLPTITINSRCDTILTR